MAVNNYRAGVKGWSTVTYFGIDPAQYKKLVENGLDAIRVSGADEVHFFNGDKPEGLEVYQVGESLGSDEIHVFSGSNFVGVQAIEVAFEPNLPPNVALTVGTSVCSLRWNATPEFKNEVTVEIPTKHFFWKPFTVLMTRVEGVMESPPVSYYCFAEDFKHALDLCTESGSHWHALYVGEGHDEEEVVAKYWAENPELIGLKPYQVLACPVDIGKALFWPCVSYDCNALDGAHARQLADKNKKLWEDELPKGASYNLLAYQVDSLQDAVNQYLSGLTQPEIHTFNSGRMYSARGQRIAWAPVKLTKEGWHIVMADVDSSFSYRFVINEPIVSDSIVLAYYDNNLGTVELYSDLVERLCQAAAAL